LAVELARMLSAFPAQKTDEKSTKLRMEAYFEVLGGVPVWTVSAARLAALRGEGGCDPRFAPTSSQIAVLANKRLQDVRDEISMLTKLLQVKPAYEEPSLEEYERVNQGFSELKAGLTPKAGEKPRETFLEMCGAVGVDPGSIPDAPEGR